MRGCQTRIIIAAFLALIAVFALVASLDAHPDPPIFYAWLTDADTNGFTLIWDADCCIAPADIYLNTSTNARDCFPGVEYFMTVENTGTRRLPWHPYAPQGGDYACAEIECPTIYGVFRQPSGIYVAPAPNPGDWGDACVPMYLDVIGAGMGDEHVTVNPQSIVLERPEEVTWLLAQVTGLMPTPRQVVFYTSKEMITISSPTSAGPYGWSYEVGLQPTDVVTVFVDGNAERARGLILYAKRSDGNGDSWTWTNVGETTNVFVYHTVHTTTVSIPPLIGETDVAVRGVVIDNNDDPRVLIFRAEAGGVVSSVVEAQPTCGPGLSLLSLVLRDVPTETDQVVVSLQSPKYNGDSAVWMGIGTSYRCIDTTYPTGTLTVHVNPADDVGYLFRATGGVGEFVLRGGQSQTIHPRLGECVVSERPPIGWTLTGITCTAPFSPMHIGPDLWGTKITTELGGGMCIFDNAYVGQRTIFLPLVAK